MLCIVYNNVCWNFVYVGYYCSHSLRGLCGLKYPGAVRPPEHDSHSLRGLCGLKYPCVPFCLGGDLSQPARAVWIEIRYMVLIALIIRVTACEGCVDWNMDGISSLKITVRHSLRGLCGLKSQDAYVNCVRYDVTACEGCVDWNKADVDTMQWARASQPARAVWIEIFPESGSSCGRRCHSLRGLCGLKFGIWYW